MVVQTASSEPQRAVPKMLLGAYSAVAETAWMGVAQATEFLEPVRAGRWLRASRGAGLLNREFTIGQATLLLMGSFLFSAALGAVRQVLFNAEFGVGQEANAYYAAFRLPDLLFSLVAGGALSSAMIPVLASAASEESEAAGQRVASLVMGALLVLFAVVVLLVELVLPGLVTTVLAPGFDAPTSDLTITLTRIMLIQPVFLAVGSVATAVLNARSQFLLTGLSVASHNLCLIAGILASRVSPDLGIYGPTLGVVAGAVLQVVILLPGLRAGGLRLHLAWDPADRRLREILRLLVPNGLAVGVVYAGSIADTAFASTARDSAGLPALHNAWLLVGLPISLLGQAVGQSAFPRLAGYAASAEWRTLRQTILRSSAAAVGLSLPALLGLAVLGRLMIHLLFEHGRFEADAGALTYVVLVIYALALPAYVGAEIFSRGLISLRDTRTPLLTNTGQVLGRVAIMALLIGSIGVLAVPTAFAIMGALESVLLGAILLIKLRRLMHPTLVQAGSGPYHASQASLSG